MAPFSVPNKNQLARYLELFSRTLTENYSRMDKLAVDRLNSFDLGKPVEQWQATLMEIKSNLLSTA